MKLKPKLLKYNLKVKKLKIYIKNEIRNLTLNYYSTISKKCFIYLKMIGTAEAAECDH